MCVVLTGCLGPAGPTGASGPVGPTGPQGPQGSSATYSGTGGVDVTGSVVSLSTAGCAAGSVWSYTGASWACGAVPQTTNASLLTSGTVAVGLYSAYADLGAEGYLGNTAGMDLLTRDQSDARYLMTAGGGTVTGSVIATSFAVAPARTDYLSIPGYAIAGSPWWLHTGFGEIMPGVDGTTSWGAIPVYLPNGATITAIQCTLKDNDTGGAINVGLRRVTDTGDTTMMVVPPATTTNAPFATGTATTTTGGTWQVFSCPSATCALANAVIDNSVASYYFEISAVKQVNMSVGLRRCLITYTTTKP